MKKTPLQHPVNRHPICSKCIFLLAIIFFTWGGQSFAQDNTWFKDVSNQVGFYNMRVTSAIALDVNNDDYPDIITTFNYQTADTGWHLYINTPDPTNSQDPKARVFVDATKNSGLNPTGMMKDFACAGDYNNDGKIDIILTTWYMDSTYDFTNQTCAINADNNSRLHILLGDGQGHFTMKSNSNLEALGPQASGSLLSLDYNKDGNLDLFVGNHYKNWCYGVPMTSYMLKGNGDGSFTNVTTTTGLHNIGLPLFGGNTADWNNDCNQDILTAPYMGSGYANLFKNNGNGTFTDVGAAAGYDPHFTLGDNGQQMVPWAAMPCDYDNDGDLDFMVLEVHGGTGATEGRTTIFTNGGATNNYKLVPNLSQITRSNPQNSHHGDHGGFWSDFDNDGWSDLMIGDAAYTLSPSSDGQRMFFCHQDHASHQFMDITKALGFIGGTTVSTISDKIRRPGCMLPIDYDNDGDEDICKLPYDGNDTLNFLILRNDIANKNHYIKIKLVSSAGVNSSCIGARVRIKADGMWQMREIYGNGGHWTNQQPLTLNFGIGAATKVDSIEVKWPDASCTKTVVNNVPADQFIGISKQGLFAGNLQIPDRDFTLYPNPVGSDVLNLKFLNSFKGWIEVYNLLGQKVVSVEQTANASEIKVSLKGVAPGVYFLNAVGTDGTRVVKEFSRNAQ